MIYKIRNLKSANRIYSALLECADCIYDQSYNNEMVLKSLSKKYSKNAFFYILLVDKTLAGFIAFYGNDISKKTAFISMVVVKNTFQGLGIGSILLDLAFSLTKLHGMTKMLLEVNNKNKNALSFYTKKGFVFHHDGKKDSAFLIKKY